MDKSARETLQRLIENVFDDLDYDTADDMRSHSRVVAERARSAFAKLLAETLEAHGYGQTC